MKDPSRKLYASVANSSFSLPTFTTNIAPLVVVYGTRPSALPNASASPSNQFVTVKQLAAEYSHIFTEGAIRNLIWQAEAHARNPLPGKRLNGFCAVIHRPGNGRKILLNRSAFLNWITCKKIGEANHGE
ncbi:hypothetical protein os1_02730 [Comamonadaceae bacterium OS-1]|nr:hypothetical protein os1_02730 [Comamonadaceae bacterium OS-1]